MSQDPFPVGTTSAYSEYVHRLRDALRARDWIADPSYALQSDSAIYTKIMRDPVAAHAIRYRCHLVAGAEWRVEAASEEPADKKAAELMEDLLGHICGATDARARLALSIFRGSAYAFIGGRRYFTTIGGHPGQWWVPQRLVDVDRRRFRLARVPDHELMPGDEPWRWEFWSVMRSTWDPIENPEWFIRTVYEETEDTLGHGRGLLDTLYYHQAAKARAFQDVMAASERFGQGLIVAKVANLRTPDGMGKAVGRDDAGQALANTYHNTLLKHRARGVLVVDQNDELDVLEQGSGPDFLLKVIEYLDASQVCAVLGATIPTMERQGGSFALGKVQENTTESLIQADRARLSEDIDRDLGGMLWRLNRQQLIDAGLALAKRPKITVVQQKREDPSVAAGVVAQLLGSNVRLRADEVYRKTGFTPPGEDDVRDNNVIEPAPPQQQGPPPQEQAMHRARGRGFQHGAHREMWEWARANEVRFGMPEGALTVYVDRQFDPDVTEFAQARTEKG